MESDHDNDHFRHLKFEDLPVDVLLFILQFLDLRSLSSLCQVSKKFYWIINEEFLNTKSYSLLVTNQYSTEIQERSHELLTSINKYKTHYFWRKKYCQEEIYLETRVRYRPWLALRKYQLLISRGDQILSLKRTSKGVSRIPVVTFKGHSEDVTRFVVREDNELISGASDGRITCWNMTTGKDKFSVTNKVKWNECVYVDCTCNTVASGFNLSGLLKFWIIRDDKFELSEEVNVTGRIWSLKLNNDSSLCAVGFDGFNSSSPLRIFDVNRNGLVSVLAPTGGFKNGAAIFDIKWETPQMLVTGSFDTFIRLWDTRVGQCVHSWSDPYDAAVYSLATDNHWTILAGTALHGRVTLWDKRVSNCIQMYFMRSKTKECGPVYSLDFDPCNMFVLLDSSLRILDFTVPASCQIFNTNG